MDKSHPIYDLLKSQGLNPDEFEAIQVTPEEMDDLLSRGAPHIELGNIPTIERLLRGVNLGELEEMLGLATTAALAKVLDTQASSTDILERMSRHLTERPEIATKYHLNIGGIARATVNSYNMQLQLIRGVMTIDPQNFPEGLVRVAARASYESGQQLIASIQKGRDAFLTFMREAGYDV